MAAFFAGLAGGIYAHLMQSISPRDFSFLVSIDILLMVVLGGLGSTSGSIVAAIFLTFATESLRAFQALRVIIYSFMLIIIMLFRPQGLMGGKELSWDAVQSFFKSKQKQDLTSAKSTEGEG
jgi:branched-chain amino acid transport system permease protein